MLLDQLIVLLEVDIYIVWLFLKDQALLDHVLTPNRMRGVHRDDGFNLRLIDFLHKSSLQQLKEKVIALEKFEFAKG